MIGYLIQQFRLQSRLTLKYVANLLDCSIVYISDIEQNKRKFRKFTKIRKLSEIVGDRNHEILQEALLWPGSREQGLISDDWYEIFYGKYRDGIIYLPYSDKTVKIEWINFWMRVKIKGVERCK